MAARIQIDIIGPLPNEVDIEDLTAILEELRQAVAACAPLDDGSNNLRMSLVDIVTGSDGLVMELQSGAAAAMAKISNAMRLRSFEHLPSRAHKSLYAINSFASRRKWGIRFHANESIGVEFVEMTAPDHVSPPSQRPTISGSTSLLARCLRVGGATRPRAELRLSNHNLLHVEMSELAARELGKRLYDEVVLGGVAVWDAVDHELLDFKVTEVSPFRSVPPVVAFRELASAAAGRWDHVDAEEFVRHLRRSAD